MSWTRLFVFMVPLCASAVLAQGGGPVGEFAERQKQQRIRQLEAKIAGCDQQVEKIQKGEMSLGEPGRYTKSQQIAIVQKERQKHLAELKSLKAGPTPAPTLDPHSLELGQQGKFADQHDDFYFEIKDVRGDKEVVVLGLFASRSVVRVAGQSVIGNRVMNAHGEFFCVRGMPTKGKVEGRRIELTGLFKVTDTTKHRAKTIFVVEPLSNEEQAKVEDELRLLSERDAKAKQEGKETANRAAAAKAAADAERKAETSEAAAAGKLSLIRQLIDLDKKDVARLRLQELIRDYPTTKAADEARTLLKKL